MIPIKSKEQITEMRDACRITAEAMAKAIEMIREGISTLDIDRNPPLHRKPRCKADFSRLWRIPRKRVHKHQ